MHRPADAGNGTLVTRILRPSAKAVISDDPLGFIKIVSDPAAGVVLGGSIVGRHAAN
jgi:dihydrolipoamide dehydrogenase